MKKIIVLLLSMSIIQTWAYDVKVNGIYYNLNKENKTAEVTNDEGFSWKGSYSGHVVIPSKISGYTVVSIGKEAFLNCEEVKDVIIPSSVITIDDNAFHSCKSILYISIPNSVTSIGESAFAGCEQLTKLTIPNSVNRIGKNAFASCYGLTTLTLPNSLISIEDGTFSDCSEMTSINIPNTVVNIGKNAFQYCSELTSITIPESVTNIGDYAFRACNKLTSVTIPRFVTNIGIGTFGSCENLTEITVENGNNNFVAIDNVLFDIKRETLFQCSMNKEGDYIIPNTVVHISDYAFYSCEKLTSVVLPNTTISIGDNAFDSCTGIRKLTLSNSLKVIGSDAFSGCSELTSVIIPNSVDSIGAVPFNGCSKLTKLIVKPGNKHYISIDNVLFDKDVTTLIQYPAGKKGSYTIPATVTSIGYGAFHNSKNLTTLVIPTSVNEIGYSAFMDCDGLKSVLCPVSLRDEAESSFEFCDNIESVSLYSENVHNIVDKVDLSKGYAIGSYNVEGNDETFNLVENANKRKQETTLDGMFSIKNGESVFYEKLVSDSILDDRYLDIDSLRSTFLDTFTKIELFDEYKALFDYMVENDMSLRVSYNSESSDREVIITITPNEIATFGDTSKD